jgi:peptidoglycan hydrolase-like protein with peptidoglycan-binding domain
MGGLVLDATATFPFGYVRDDDGVSGLGQRLTFAQLEQQPTWRNLHPEFRRRVAALMMAAAAQQVPLGIGTGWRSHDTQLAGYRRDPRGHARPGNSNHEGFPGNGNGDRDAVAADMVPAGSWAWMGANCATFGLRTFHDINNEPWHIQPVEIPAGRGRRVLRWDLAPWPLPGPSDPLSEPASDTPIVTSQPTTPSTTNFPTLERIEVPMNKTVLHPDLRAQLAGNDDVRLVQVLALGLHAVSGHPVFDVGPVDADYGPRTQAAARLMQQLNGLDADGIVGPLSWAAFLNADGL